MIDVGLLSVIRRWYHREQFSLREIAKRTGLSRNTVRRYLRREMLEPSYTKHKRISQLDQYHELLIGWLQAQSTQARKQRRSVKQMYRELCSQGYSGSYDRVAAFARHFRQAQREEQGGANRKTYIPLSFAPGEAFQFDWSEESAVIAGVVSKVQVAHFKLCHSRVFLLRAYWQQSHEMLFDAHAWALPSLAGFLPKGSMTI